MRICLCLFSFFLSFLSLSPPFFTVRLFLFLLFPRLFFLLVVCQFLSWFGCVLFFLLFIFLFIHTCLSDYRSLHSSTYIYTYTYAYLLSVYSAESIFPSLCFLHKFYCTNVQPKVNPSLRHQCDNTRFCNSLHKLLSPRRELMCGRIRREAGSQSKEQKYNFVVKTLREDGERVIISSKLSFGWQKIILTNLVRLVTSLFVVSLFRPNQLSSNPN